ncbi:DUF475 domain-containing protein [Fodinicola feengrottensis]|uniref:DUF475 domain-containing protein n=1 Tax=Fodinicola feengrottensis TaxID=435914 RepID=A0ABP4U9X2_9ACTN|nr:DUF475 domain-containing protein [Fodinicola feengrottensis]
MILKTFRWAFVLTAVGLVGGFLLGFREGGTLSIAFQSLLLVAILSILEISLSFDNAVVNATILERMSPFWQKMFLTVGILIAVFGMRLIFPLIIVSITAPLNPVEVIQLALQGGTGPGSYAQHLHEAHPAIAAFGGMFLFMIFLAFVLEDNEISWLTWLERPLAKIGKLDQLNVVIALIVLLIAAETLTGTQAHNNPTVVLIAGSLGIVSYLLVNGLGELFETSADEAHEEAEGAAAKSGPSGTVKAVGKAAFFLFLYLEVLDASFSFDGVIGAFAITSDIFIIAIGLGVGAMYIRSLTVYLVRKGTLNEYVFLEHGAMWAIGALSIILMVTIRFEVPEVVTGLIGVAFIAAAFISSLVRNRREAAVEGAGSGEQETVKV